MTAENEKCTSLLNFMVRPSAHRKLKELAGDRPMSALFRERFKDVLEPPVYGRGWLSDPAERRWRTKETA